MTTQETLDSGNLELYVYGVLNESDTKEISELVKTDKAIADEVVSIEKSILNLSSSFHRIFQLRFLKNQSQTRIETRKSN